MMRERIVFEHGPADGYTYFTRPTTATIVVPVVPVNYAAVFVTAFFDLTKRNPFFAPHNYHRTPRNSGAPEFRRIYTWVE